MAAQLPIPVHPLPVGTPVTVEITLNGQDVNWLDHVKAIGQNTVGPTQYALVDLTGWIAEKWVHPRA